MNHCARCGNRAETKPVNLLIQETSDRYEITMPLEICHTCACAVLYLVGMALRGGDPWLRRQLTLNGDRCDEYTGGE